MAWANLCDGPHGDDKLKDTGEAGNLPVVPQPIASCQVPQGSLIFGQQWVGLKHTILELLPIFTMVSQVQGCCLKISDVKLQARTLMSGGQH